jgi:SAM-dependent methyltransferase
MTVRGPDQTPEGWDAFIEGYERFMVPFFARFAADALRLADVQPGDRLLDVAAGPGTLALQAARRGATVVAIDFAPGMIARLHVHASEAGLANLTAAVMDGQALSLADDSFDAAFSMFGLIFFPDRAAGFRELRRVLRPGGKAVVGTWSRTGTAIRPAARHALPAPPTPRQVQNLHDPELFAREMRAGGFTRVEVQTIAHDQELPTPEATWELVTHQPTILAIYTPDQLAAARPIAIEALCAEFGDGPVRLEWEAHIGIGTK